MIGVVVLLQATLSIAVGGPTTSPEYLPVHVAQAAGLFTKAGQPVALQTERADGPAGEALGRGQVQLAATSLDAALGLGHVRGAPPRLVFGLTSAPPVVLLLPAAPAASVLELRDLMGKVVGIPGPGTPEHLVLLSLLSRAGLPPSRLSIHSFGERGLAAAIEAGTVTAGVLGDPWATRLLEEGRARALADMRRATDRQRWLGPPAVSAGLYLRAGSSLGVQELAPVLRALLAAIERVETASAADLRALLPGSVVGDPEHFALRLQGARAIYLERGRVTRAMLEAAVALAQERHPIPATVKLPRLDRLLFLAPLDAAEQRGWR